MRKTQEFLLQHSCLSFALLLRELSKWFLGPALLLQEESVHND